MKRYGMACLLAIIFFQVGLLHARQICPRCGHYRRECPQWGRDRDATWPSKMEDPFYDFFSR